MIKVSNLKNGLKIIKLSRQSNLVTVGFLIKSGSQTEFEGKYTSGISALVERLFWYGTDKHPSKRQLNRALEAIGGNFYSFTNQEFSEFYITVPKEHQFKAITMMAEIIQKSKFDERDIEEEKNFIIQKGIDYEVDTGYAFSELAVSNLYEKYGYSAPIFGEIDTIKSINEEEIKDYISRQYVPENAYLIICGNIDKQLSDSILQEWGNWSGKTDQSVKLKRFPIEEIKESLPKINYRQRGLPETQIVCGFLMDEGAQPRLLRETSEEALEAINIEKVKDKILTDWAHSLLLNAILGQGLSSRLWLRGVEEEALFYYIHSDIIRFSRSSFLQIRGTADNNQFTFALESILSTLQQLKGATISINEITKAKESLKGKIIMEQENLISAAIWQVENIANSSLIYTIEDVLEKIKSIDTPSLRTAAEKIFTKERFFLTTLGTAKETLIIEKLINKYL